MNRWFICDKDRVQGPLGLATVRSRCEKEPGAAFRVWGRHLPHWLTPRDFLIHLEAGPKPKAPAPSKTELWHFAHQGQTYGPLTRPDLIKQLGQIENSRDVMVWTKGMKSWVDLGYFHDILDELGLNRRVHPRIDYSGTIKLTDKNLNKFESAVMTSLSAGGFGGQEFTFRPQPGRIYDFHFQAAELSLEVRGKASCQYYTKEGVGGFKFQSLDRDLHDAIQELVKKKTEAA